MKKRSKRVLTGSALIGAGALVLFALPAGAITSSDDAAPRATPLAASQKVSVPAYFYPGATWDRLIEAGSGVGLAIANPDNGPGAGQDSQYTETIRRAGDAGAKVIGYVATGYFGTSGKTTRSGSTDPDAWMQQIKGDIDAWYSLYGDTGLAGIFFDEGMARCGSGNADVNRYIELREYVESNHGEDAVVVDNPGTGVEECYTQAADTLVTFEGSDSSYRDHQPQDWEKNVAADKIWHLVYDVPDETRMSEAMALSKERNAGHVYITPDSLADDNPWDTLPPESYWKSQLSLAAGA
ncbi:Spherulation-specific family 4 [Streptomyces sp. ADI96-02]|uniref:spherulation-specific family 4 protein n=1 Tax=Streptomyces sp. ADI96-02 TaxID=1522760 RepID=UPI000F55354E|nr:spherulation-specific family 4 protein [Streptomyces sp. ADI96-02]RPK67416.1 Spherulation-specific family 4 [Streptomyces sp. ADI96-02]